MPKGCFIVFEGIDGSGKSTQFRMLSENLENAKYEVVRTKEPTPQRPIGKLIREILYENKNNVPEESLALLFAADRIDHINSIIKPALEEGSIVLSDRYVYSSFAYQSKGMQKEIDLTWLSSINRYAIDPDIVVFLDITPEEGLKRGDKRIQDHTYFGSLKQQKRIRSVYYRIFQLDKKYLTLDDFKTRKKKKENNIQITQLNNTVVIRIDSTLSINRINKILLDIIIKYLENEGIARKDDKVTEKKHLTTFS